jgi:hypothetical protein
MKGVKPGVEPIEARERRGEGSNPSFGTCHAAVAVVAATPTPTSDWCGVQGQMRRISSFL